MVEASESMLRELHRLARSARLPSLCEAIRLLESDKFSELTEPQIHEVASYRPIELGDEWFFRGPFTPGKEAAASLAFARYLGREVVLDDLQRLRESLGVEASA